MSPAEQSINLRQNPALHPDRYSLSVQPKADDCDDNLFLIPHKIYTTRFTRSKRTQYTEKENPMCPK